jgi:hypothetical protein
MVTISRPKNIVSPKVQQRQVNVGEPARDLLQLVEEEGVAGDVDAEGDLTARVLELNQAPHHWRQHFGDGSGSVRAVGRSNISTGQNQFISPFHLLPPFPA